MTLLPHIADDPFDGPQGRRCRNALGPIEQHRQGGALQ